jgi:Flp pilus assembly pilin Flp
MLPMLVRLHVIALTLRARLDDERGQTTAEYALVLLGAASVALLIAVWAKESGKVGQLLDAIFGSLVKMVKS